jgi:hypothetical protein
VPSDLPIGADSGRVERVLPTLRGQFPVPPLGVVGSFGGWPSLSGVAGLIPSGLFPAGGCVSAGGNGSAAIGFIGLSFFADIFAAARNDASFRFTPAPFKAFRLKIAPAWICPAGRGLQGGLDFWSIGFLGLLFGDETLLDGVDDNGLTERGLGLHVGVVGHQLGGAGYVDLCHLVGVFTEHGLDLGLEVVVRLPVDVVHRAAQLRQRVLKVG